LAQVRDERDHGRRHRAIRRRHGDVLGFQSIAKVSSSNGPGANGS
jgi:hypothetical protein